MISSVVVESRRELIGGVIVLCNGVVLRSTEASRDTVPARVVLAEGFANGLFLAEGIR